MSTKIVNGERVAITSEEEQEIKANIDVTEIRKKRLLDREKERAIETLVAPQKAAIDRLSKEEVDAVYLAGGLDEASTL